MNTLKATFFSLVLFVAFSATALKAQPAPTEQQLRQYYSLFNEYAKNQDWAMALNTVGNVKKNLHGILNLPQLREFRPIVAKRILDTYKGAADLPANTDKKSALLDSVVVLYDTLPVILKTAGTEVDLYQWTFDKGYFLQNKSADLPAKYRADILPTYLKAFELDPVKLGDYYKIFILKGMIESGKKDEAMAFSEKLRPYLSNEQSIAALDGHINNMFTNPAERITFLEGQLVKNSKDIKKTEELFRLYNRYTTLKGKADTLITSVMQNLLPDSTITLTTTLYNAIGAKIFNNDVTQIPAALVFFNKGLEVAKENYEIKAANYITGLMNQSQNNFEAAYHNGKALVTLDSTFAEGHALVANSLKSALTFLPVPVSPEEKLAYLEVIYHYDKAIALSNPTTDTEKISQYTESKADAVALLPNSATLTQKGWLSGTEIYLSGRLTWLTGSVKIP